MLDDAEYCCDGVALGVVLGAAGPKGWLSTSRENIADPKAPPAKPTAPDTRRSPDGSVTATRFPCKEGAPSVAGSTNVLPLLPVPNCTRSTVASTALQRRRVSGATSGAGRAGRTTSCQS